MLVELSGGGAASQEAVVELARSGELAVGAGQEDLAQAVVGEREPLRALGVRPRSDAALGRSADGFSLLCPTRHDFLYGESAVWADERAAWQNKAGGNIWVATFGWQHLGGNIWVATFGWPGTKVGIPTLQKNGQHSVPQETPGSQENGSPKKRAAFPQGGDPGVWGLGCSEPPHSLDGSQAPQPARASQEAMGYAWPHLNPKRRVPPPLAGPPGRDPEPPPASEVPRLWAAAQRAH